MGIRQPTEKMIEAAILHHHDDDVFDLRRGRPQHLRAKRRTGCQSTCSFEKGPTIHSLFIRLECDACIERTLQNVQTITFFSRAARRAISRSSRDAMTFGQRWAFAADLRPPL